MWFDLLVVAILLFATFRGAMKGIVWQLAVIASLVFCFFFAGSLSAAIAPMIPVEAPLNRWIAMFILYIGFSFVAFGAARVLREMIEKIKFVEFDKHLGAALGFIKGVTFCLFLTFFLVTLSGSARESILQSRSGYAAAIIMDRLHPVMPHELHDVLEPYIHQLDRPDMDLKHVHDEHEHGYDPDVDHFQDSPQPPQSPKPSLSSLLKSFVTKPAVRTEAPPVPYSPSSLPEDANDPFADANPDMDAGRDIRRVPSPPRVSLHDDFVQREGSSGDYELMKYLPAALDGNLQREAIEALKRTKPEHREELARRLASGSGSLLQETIRLWQRGKPASEGQAGNQRTRLQQEIAGLLQSSGRSPQNVQAEIQSALNGVPEAVGVKALEDWRSDLRGDRPDPDPQTNSRTLIDVRIARQLAAAGISPGSLSSALQQRLRSTQTR